MDGYFSSDKPPLTGLPTVAYCADQLHLSANYFGDLIKKLENLHWNISIIKIIDTAKSKIFDANKTINEIAYELGFKYPQHFMRLFKSRVGYTPNEYRNLN